MTLSNLINFHNNNKDYLCCSTITEPIAQLSNKPSPTYPVKTGR